MSEYIIMSNHRLTTQQKDIKSAIMDELEGAVDEYLESFRLRSDNGNSLPSINEIEDIVSELRSKTRDIYLSMISDSISSFDESNLIDSKKPSTGKEG